MRGFAVFLRAILDFELMPCGFLRFFAMRFLSADLRLDFPNFCRVFFGFFCARIFPGWRLVFLGAFTRRKPSGAIWYNRNMGLEEIEQKEYFSIGDVKRITGVPEYSVRYWEAEFGLIKPIRKESGHRRYTKNDVYTILKIKDLIYKHKLTLEGAKKQLSKYQFPSADEPKARTNVKILEEIKETLEELLKEC